MQAVHKDFIKKGIYFFVWFLFCSFHNFNPSDYHLVVLVDARQLHYCCLKGFLKTVAKHPSDGSKNGDIGHAWLLLRGKINGRWIEIEGGLSQKSTGAPSYFQLIADRIEQGDKNPAEEFFKKREEGFFERGSGGHLPTCAVCFSITEEQFYLLYSAILEHPFKEYSLQDNQCCSFVVDIAKRIGLDLEKKTTIFLPKYIQWGKMCCLLWEDPFFSVLKITTPEALQEILKEKITQREGEEVIEWYLKTHPESFRHRLKKCLENLIKLPQRLLRYFQINCQSTLEERNLNGSAASKKELAFPEYT